MSEKETEISTLGEFGLIDRITESFKLNNESSIVGVGDDAAVLDYKNKKTLVTTDLLLEGIHFDLRYVALKHLGYKAAVVNFSDIYAMNGMIDDAMKYWKQALDGDGQNAVLKWKINNRQYITEDELLRRNRPAKKESVTKKIIKKGRKR